MIISPSEQCRQAGLESLAELIQLTGLPKRTLIRWHKTKPRLFELVLKGVASEKDDHLLDVLEDQCWDVRCIALEDTWMWQIVGHYMGNKPYRTLGESWESDGVRLAIKEAIKTTDKDCYNYLYEFNE